MEEPQEPQLGADAGADAELNDEDALPVEPAMRRFLDLPIEVRIELDRKRITLGEALALKAHMVIALERSAGENVDLLLNGMRVGNGEIVVIEDTMGLRLTDLRRDVLEDKE